ncbi:NAD(P)-dependent dehydrogenase (short-subunit alcohol dehydrogenase family) [Acidovorax delafieldii]|uniref:NAD(P)-dependent dehydrogenase (Short-subunit alcohol dehydrogenase family) n=1 Tax=Acidovorax delafieldii TaxID=47920 RepID=A0A561XC77_ACIDE|nr:NAD(P)-dependent dehydrogenase (short-subunit alcohol dehydrogenase family) [Acidovorax delafieldii]
MSLFDLQGRTALVTGATQGLGLAIARTLAEQGARVVVSDRDALACEQVAASLPNAIGIAADMAVPAAIAALVERAGPLDILVCNAGIQGPAGPLANASDADWQQVFDINLCAAARLCALVLPGMAARGGGSAVLISRIAGLRGNRSMGLYGLTKAALAQLARNLAVEWVPMGVRVNAVSPGLIRTPLAERLMADDAFMARRIQATPLRRRRTRGSGWRGRHAGQPRRGLCDRTQPGGRRRHHHQRWELKPCTAC